MYQPKPLLHLRVANPTLLERAFMPGLNFGRRVPWAKRPKPGTREWIKQKRGERAWRNLGSSLLRDIRIVRERKGFIRRMLTRGSAPLA